MARESALAIALPLVALWLAGPVITWWYSLPTPLRVDEPLTATQERVLRRIARKTWRFFETFVVEHGHQLAPDNFQEDPAATVAWRTSPTNIGLQLLSYVTAYDLGYLTVEALTDRTAATLSAMTGLERYRGHYYNWYDIATLEPHAAGLRVDRRLGQPRGPSARAARGATGGVGSTTAGSADHARRPR